MITPKVGTPIRLGAPVDLQPGEWLHSAISRWAWQEFGVSRAALLGAFGLSRISTHAVEGLGTRLLPEIAANISSATGIDTDRLRAATMEHLYGSFLWLSERTDGQRSAVVSKLGTWSWQTGTRYCPDCLTEQPGVFHVMWRSPWTFACIKHRRVLLDTCPECHREIVEMRGRNTDLFDPATCRANTAPKGASRRIPCRAALADTWEHARLEEHSMPLLTQQLISLQAQQGTGIDFIQLLQSAATALRGAQAFDAIGQLSGMDAAELRGLVDEEKHVGISPPKNAYAMAALTSAALALTRIDERHAKALIRHATFSRPPGHVPRGVGFGPGSPQELLARWPGATYPFSHQILRALDHDLTVSQRILWDTAVHPNTITEHPAAHRRGLPVQRQFVVPEQLWPAWCSRLDVGGKVDAATLAQALAAAVRVSGAAAGPRDDVAKHLAAILRKNMLGTPEHTDALLAGISELAHTLDDNPIVINYPRRTHLPARPLLPQEHWELLADSIGRDPGNRRRHRNARRFVWHRLTAMAFDNFPPELRFGRSRDDTAEYTIFCTRMTAELQEALDRYGLAFLRAHGISEPVTWTPAVAVSIEWPGPDITDLDIDLLHTMLLDGVHTHHQLAKALNVSTRRVFRAIDAAPPKTSRAVSRVDWTPFLPARWPDDHSAQQPRRDLTPTEARVRPSRTSSATTERRRPRHHD